MPDTPAFSISRYGNRYVEITDSRAGVLLALVPVLRDLEPNEEAAWAAAYLRAGRIARALCLAEAKLTEATK